MWPTSTATARRDIFFKHADGRVYVYRMDGLAVVGGKELLGAGLGWSVSHAADLNGDGKADLVLRHADGRAHLWLMDGTDDHRQRRACCRRPRAGASCGTGDLNGDGQAPTSSSCTTTAAATSTS